MVSKEENALFTLFQPQWTPTPTPQLALDVAFRAVDVLDAVVKWATDPAVISAVSPPVGSFAIESDASSDGHRRVVRRLLPKRADKNVELREQIDIWTERAEEVRVQFTPLPDGDGSVPTYYPQISSYVVAYTTASSAPAKLVTTVLSAPTYTALGRLSLTWTPLLSTAGASAATDDDAAAAAAATAATATAEDPAYPPSYWKLHHLFHRLFKWATHNMIGKYVPVRKDALVPKDAYREVYRELKERHSDLYSSWTESTDPQKFVTEDLAIASYLICLWRSTGSPTPVSFIDLGCGNGLLTYLLHKEGFHGYGVDIRRRKIWARWRDQGVDLREETIDVHQFRITPTPDHTTWVLGNHADELTPWIPLIATLSSPDLRLVLIPCCFFHLNGRKWAPPPSSAPAPAHLAHASTSRYKRYLQYVGEVVAQCGYVVEWDSLRIPSTKNVAVVAQHRRGADEEYKQAVAHARNVVQAVVPVGKDGKPTTVLNVTGHS
ncbi:tRNA(Ser) Um(44) 2'-O-methyltransferase [Sorochytrium milnesiophthora]